MGSDSLKYPYKNNKIYNDILEAVCEKFVVNPYDSYFTISIYEWCFLRIEVDEININGLSTKLDYLKETHHTLFKEDHSILIKLLEPVLRKNKIESLIKDL